MNNATLHTADSLTHIKIALVSLLACIVVIAAGTGGPKVIDMRTRLELRARSNFPGNSR